MDAADAWGVRLSSASKRYQSALQSRSDMLMGFEDLEGDDDIREEFPCPFCSEYFDIVGLCCHIDDEHPVEAKNGVCPVCAIRVGVDMVAHITLQHGNIFKVQRKRKSRKGGSHSTLSLLRELREGNLQSLFGGSSCVVSSSNSAPDPLLSSFILPMPDDFGSSQSNSRTETVSAKKGTSESTSQRSSGQSDPQKSTRKKRPFLLTRSSGQSDPQKSTRKKRPSKSTRKKEMKRRRKAVQSAPLSIKDQKERARRSEFAQGLLMSTIFDDDNNS